MNTSEYKYIYSYMKCPKRRINVYTVSTYQYNSANNNYKLVERTCKIALGQHEKFNCDGRNEYGNPCYVINPPSIELPPDCPDFD